jgi:hypothetical protein
MKKYLTWFLDEFDYPEFSKKSLLDCYEKIAKCDTTYPLVCQMLDEYERDINFNPDDFTPKMQQIAQTLNISAYTVDLLVLILMTKHLKSVYEREGVDEEIWRTGVTDLKYKDTECTLIHGVSGTFVTWWFYRLLNFTRFAFHKLQFQIVPFKGEYDKDGLSLREGDSVIEVHIPRTGTRLDRESLLLSYKCASEFFQSRFNQRPVFVCASWLLYPENKNMLKPGSNLLAFMNDYDIIMWENYENYDQRWRLFDTMEEDIDRLPSDTSFRRSYIERMRNGLPLGWGYGVLDYDKLNN